MTESLDGWWVCLFPNKWIHCLARKGPRRPPPWSPCWDNEGLCSLCSRVTWVSDTKGEEVVQEVWGYSFFSLRGCSCSDLTTVFSTQGSTHLRLSLNTCLFLLVTNQNCSERIQRNVVKRARELESEPIWVLLLLDCVALGWSLKFFGPYVHSVSQGCGATLQWPWNTSSCSIVQGDAQDPNENVSTSTVDYRK